MPLFTELDKPDLLAAGDLLPWLAVTAAVAEETPTAMSLFAQVESVTDQTGDAYHRAHAEAARCLIAALLPGRVPDIDVVTRARDAYARAMDVEHLVAAWMSCNALAVRALRTASPREGLVWAQRGIALSIARRPPRWHLARGPRRSADHGPTA